VYSSSNIIRMIKSRRIRWAEYQARMERKINAHRIFMRNQDEKKSKEGSRDRCEYDTKPDLICIEAGLPRSKRSRPDRVKNFHFYTSSRLPWDPLSLPYNGCGSFHREVKPTTHLQLVPRPRKSGSIQPLPRTSSWSSAY
jgi:hypothetical protein